MSLSCVWILAAATVMLVLSNAPALGQGQPAGAGSTMPASAPSASPVRLLPVCYCPKTDRPPVLDGTLDDECWRSAGVLSDFVLFDQDAFLVHSCEARICHDDQWLYVAVRCAEPNLAGVKAKATGRTNPWDDDCVEIFIDTKRDGKDYEHFGVNILGGNNLPLPEDDASAAVLKVARGEGQWMLEARVPISALTDKAPKPGDVWGLNIARNRQNSDGRELGSWARLHGSFHKWGDFGLMVLCDTLPKVRLASIDLGEKFTGENVALITLDASGQEVAMELTGQDKQQAVIPARADGPSTVALAYRLEGRADLTLRLSSGDATLFQALVPAEANPRPAWAKFLPGVGSVTMQLPRDVISQGEELPAGAKCRFLGGPRAVSVGWDFKGNDQPAVELASRDGKLSVPRDLPDGEGELNARLLDETGQELTGLSRPVSIAGCRLTQLQQQIEPLRARAEALVSQLQDTTFRRYAETAAAKVAKLEQFLAKDQLAQATVAAQEIDHHLTSLEHGQLPVWGQHECTYHSDIDGSDQPYTVTVPRDYDPAGKDLRPVLIWLHCWWGDGKWTAPQTYLEPIKMAALKKGFILVQPFGRGTQWYRNDGEVDVWQVWKAVNAQWRIDPDRVYISGFSMGGYGACEWAASYPQMFAAAGAYSGTMSQEFLPNLRQIPFRFEAGSLEGAAAEMAVLAQALKKVDGRSAEVVYGTGANEGHTVDYVNWESMLEWFAQYRRVKDPARVTFAANDLRHNANYWVAIDAFTQYGKLATVDAQVEGGELHITSENVAGMTLSPPASLLSGQARPKVTWNGQPRDAQLLQGKIVLSNTPATSSSPAGPVKNHAMCGPIGDAFCGPLALVAADEASVQAAKLVSDRWADWHHGTLDVMTPDQAAARMAEANVILVGPWNSPGLMSELAKVAPVHIDQDAITVAGRRQAGKDLGILFIYPSPANPSRYVVVATGQSAQGVLKACRLFQSGKYSGDYHVSDGGPHGVFDGHWK